MLTNTSQKLELSKIIHRLWYYHRPYWDYATASDITETGSDRGLIETSAGRGLTDSGADRDVTDSGADRDVTETVQKLVLTETS